MNVIFFLNQSFSVGVTFYMISLNEFIFPSCFCPHMTHLKQMQHTVKIIILYSHIHSVSCCFQDMSDIQIYHRRDPKFLSPLLFLIYFYNCRSLPTSLNHKYVRRKRPGTSQTAFINGKWWTKESRIQRRQPNNIFVLKLTCLNLRHFVTV